jgi:hypothetical protein
MSDSTPSPRSLSSYVTARLKAPSTYLLAAVVGTLINFYGHILVPWLKGDAEPWASFLHEIQHHPETTALSIIIAYLFPVAVSVYSAATTRHSTRHFESRALFPDTKPDPVFRVAKGGQITEMGATTEQLFVEHQIESASDFFGQEAWLARQSGKRPQGTRVMCERLGQAFIVSTSNGPDGSIHVYAVSEADARAQA